MSKKLTLKDLQEAVKTGAAFRSRCLLWPTELPKWELLGKPGDDPQEFELDSEQAISLLEDAIKQAVDKSKLPWRKEPLILKPAKKLVELVRKSQELAVSNGAEEGGE